MLESTLQRNRIIKLKKGTSAKSIVFIHDGCGEAIQYLELCKGISDEYSVYGMRYGIENMKFSPKVHDIKSMANYYLNLLEQEGVKEIYAILGFCIGGKIAFEMCNQLNQKVEHLVLLNAIPPNQERNKYNFRSKEEYRFIKKKCPFFRLKNKKETNTEDLWKMFSKYLAKHKLIFFVMKSFLPAYIKNIIIHFQCKDSTEEVVKYINLVRGFEETHYRYKVDYSMDATNVTCFYAEREKAYNYDKWGDVCSKINFIGVDSDHINMLSKESIDYMNEAKLNYIWGKKKLL